jgi:hypothetical protein
MLCGMKFLKYSAVIVFVLALFAPGTLSEIKAGAIAAGSNLVSADSGRGTGEDYEDRKAHRLACTLFRKWSKADETTRKASASAVAGIADKAIEQTEDPAARALLAVVPAAVGHGSSAPTRSAQMLLKRECRPAR